MTQGPKPGWRRVQLSRKDRILRSRGLHDKTLWDWMQLLVVPIVIALLAGLFTTVQILYQQAAEERLQERITDQNAEIQRFIEEQRAQSASLGAYLDLMTQMLLEQHLQDSEENSVVRAIAQAQTTRVLRDVDPGSKQTVLLFLRDAGLIFSKDRQPPIVDLSNADLRSAHLRLTDFGETDLSEVNLREADLSYADLSGANLSNSILRGAKLRGANLTNAILRGADLSGADLDGANLTKANLTYAFLERTNLSGADLSGANLSGAGLLEANMSKADLNGAQGVDTRSLEAQDVKLIGATMPNGKKHD